MTRWTRAIAVGVVLWHLAGGQPLFALTLEEAKTKGLVGEKANGYLGLVTRGNGEAEALAKDVNEKRRQAYEEIARRNGTSMSAVEVLAGEKAVQNTKPGNYVEGPGGWMKK
ncbi:MAG TPA: YdbL family protein [Nitrospiraceae bacterium]|nr:YdbL family protein [Nitrospiraceae bacterium]